MTSKEYIEAYTRRCSNLVNHDALMIYHPWLTPDNALAAVEIERQEVIEKAIEWFRQVKEQGCSFDGIDAFIVHFKEAMKEE
jgi:hypothetical protein